MLDLKVAKLAGTACVAALFLAAIPASAQDLDGTWFKVKVQAKGYTVAEETEALGTASFRTDAYVHLAWNEGKESYDVTVWTQRAASVWRPTYRTGVFAYGPNDELWVDTYLRFDDSAGRFVAGYHTLQFRLKLDKDGSVKSASFKPLGGEAVDGRFGDAWFTGSMKLGGKSVDVAKLPFDPATSAIP